MVRAVSKSLLLHLFDHRDGTVFLASGYRGTMMQAVDLAEAARRARGRTSLQGNLDPGTLRESPEVIRQGVADTLASYGKGPGHVFNLGHGITPDADPENVALMIETLRRWERSIGERVGKRAPTATRRYQPAPPMRRLYAGL